MLAKNFLETDGLLHWMGALKVFDFGRCMRFRSLTGNKISAMSHGMDLNQEHILTRDTEATIIPAGEVHTLSAGTKAAISQALGGTVTIRTDSGLFRLSAKDWDALGAEAAEALAIELEKSSATAAAEEQFSEEQVWEAMRGCYDPEIPVNIVDLGLIYDMRATGPNESSLYSVAVKMTLTAPGCGMGPVIADDAKQRIEALPHVADASVDVVWDPPWSPHMISAEGRAKLGLE